MLRRVPPYEACGEAVGFSPWGLHFRFLTHEDRVRCEMELEKGQVTKFVIQYEIFVQGEWAPVTRFDTYHNAVHRDLISPDGKVMKKWYIQFNFDEGLTFSY